MPFPLWSKNLQSEEKQIIAYKIYKAYNLCSELSMSPLKAVFPDISEGTGLNKLVGDRSIIIFKHMNFSEEDMEFFQSDVATWHEFSRIY